jgi:hypothetical protein
MTQNVAEGAAGAAAGKARRRWRRRTKVLSAFGGAVLAGGVAYAATNWVVGLNNGSSAQGQSASISNLSISAVASPAAGNLLYPGATGDAVMKITNPNPFPVTLTALQLPANTVNAAGYSDSGLSTPQTGCSAATSAVTWNFATGSSGTSHTLSSPLTVAANGNLTVTLTNDVVMASTTPAACANTFFSMPSFTGVTATGGAATVTSGPATDAWTS